jgi:imidazolonepropionase-like amidohydrolase
MVLVEGDPLADIRTARNVRKVIKNGEAFDIEELLDRADKRAGHVRSREGDRTSIVLQWRWRVTSTVHVGAFVAAILLTRPCVVSAQIVALKAGRVVDPETGTAAANQTIVVEGATIKAIGPGVPIPPVAELIDLGPASVLPGLFDCHTHLCINTGHPAGETVRNLYEALLTTTVTSTTGYRALVGAANARAMLEAGFTTVRDVGNAGNYADTDLRRAVEEGLLAGPTIVNAGRIIAPTGGQFPSRTPLFFREMFSLEGSEYIGVLPADRPGLGEPEYLYADTRDELRKAVRQNILFGTRVIKLVIDDQPYVYSPEDIRAVVEGAGKAGLKVCAHALTDQGARNGAEAGLVSIEHGFSLSADTMALMKRNGVVLVGTDFSQEIAKAVGFPAPFYARVLERVRRAHKAGVSMAFGTDIFAQPAGFTRGVFAINYVDVYKEAGVPARDVLRMMTTTAARVVGVEKQRGALKAGLAADIIATESDPLDDAAALKKVVFVMKDGKIVRR